MDILTIVIMISLNSSLTCSLSDVGKFIEHIPICVLLVPGTAVIEVGVVNRSNVLGNLLQSKINVLLIVH